MVQPFLLQASKLGLVSVAVSIPIEPFSTYSAVWEGKVLPNRNIRLGMLGLGMVLKEIHLAYATRFLFRE